MTRVRLMRPHNHAGVDYPAGATLDVAPSDARWLDRAGVAYKAPPKHTPPPIARAPVPEPPASLIDRARSALDRLTHSATDSDTGAEQP